MSEKGFLGGSMKFQVSEDESGPAEVSEGPILPLRILVATHLVPSESCNAGASAPTSPVRLDADDPEGLFKKIRPRLTIEVPSVLDGGRMTKVELAPTSLKSFRPDGLVEEVKLLRSLLDGKLVLDRLRQSEITEDQAQGQLDRLWGGAALASEVLGRSPKTPSEVAVAVAAPAAPAASGGGSGLDALLDMVDMPGGNSDRQDASSQGASSQGEQSQGEQSHIANIIAQVALGSRARAGRGKTGIPLVEEALGAQLGAILQHPEVRKMERAYRALAFLQERTSKIAGLSVEVIGIGPEGVVGSLKGAIARKEPPISFALADVEIDGSNRSLAELEALAELAEGTLCPIFVNANERLLGVDDLARVDKLDSKQNLFSAPERAPWRSTAHKQSLRWIALCTNGTLLRAPYDPKNSRIREATVRESPADQDGFVWMPPIYSLAVVCALSFKETGWPARITGPRHGVIENLPVRELEDDGAPVAIPTQVFLSTDSQRELGRIGVLALASAPNSDAAYVHTAPTAYVRPDKKTYDSASTEPEDRPAAISLVDQLFVARLVQFASALCGKIPRESPAAETAEVLKAATWQLFDKAPPSGPEIRVSCSEQGGDLVAEFVVHPRRFLGVSLEEFGFQMPVGG